MIGSLKRQLQSITSLLPDWKGPADRDRRLLFPSGRLIMQGLSSGIQAQVPDLQRQLRRLTAEIPHLGRSGVTGSPPVQAQVNHGALADAMSSGLGSAIRALAQRPVVLQVDSREIAWATETGNIDLARRG